MPDGNWPECCPTPPVLSLSNCCPNGVHISAAGLPAQFTVTSDSVVNLAVSLNGNNVGNYSGVTNQSFSLLPNPNYNEVIIVGSNVYGSNEVICYFYGTTSVGSNGSNYYYDQSLNHILQMVGENSDMLLQFYESAGLEAAINYMSTYLQGLKYAPEGATSLDGPIPSFGTSIVPAAIIAQQLSTPGSPLNMIIGQNTLIQYNSDYANNRSGQGTILLNNNQTSISWGPANWSA